jgi:cell division protein FtsW (lipid II flippase)
MNAMAEPVPVLTRPRRGAQLTLLVFAVVVTIAAFAQVGLARDGTLPVGMFGYGAALAIIVTIAYALVAKFAPYADPLLLPLAVFLNGLGLAMIYRLDTSTTPANRAAIATAKASGKSLDPFISAASTSNQMLWTALSIIFFGAVLVLIRDFRVLQRYRYTIGALGLFFLVLPGLMPASISSAGGAKVWLRLGGLSIQPGEFAKIALVIFFAAYLVQKRSSLSLVGHRYGFIELPRGRDLGPILIAWLISVGVLVIEKDIGQGILIFGLFIAMLYIATERVSWVFIGLGLFTVGAFTAMQLPSLGHVNQRITIWLNPQPYFDGGCALHGKVINHTNMASIGAKITDPSLGIDNFATRCVELGGHYSDSGQLMRGLFALGQGGILGTGLGQGQPGLIPLGYADFIFDSFGEELGLTGLMVILLAYGLLVQRGMKAALATSDPFLKLFTGGVSFVFALQVFSIVGGVTKLIPLTGLTTPFLTQGGSALLSSWMLIAILVRISDTARRPAPQPIQDEGMTQVVRLQ